MQIYNTRGSEIYQGNNKTGNESANQERHYH